MDAMEKKREQERMEGYLLCSCKGIGPVSVRKLIETAGSAVAALGLGQEVLVRLLGEKRAQCLERGREEKNRQAGRKRYDRLRERGISFLPYWDSAYPSRLKNIVDAPVALYQKGRLPEDAQKAVAIIGARECSGYGRETARCFAAGLARAGVTIISGMARGVDGIAGEAALEVGGSSVAVLGCGVDICYPPENKKLYERLEREGCLLSEYPPGTQPAAALFPPRNRIISGLADLVLVTEARDKSGTLITVDMALEQGRDVFAVPGRITDSCSRGCNRLIGNGAGAAISVPQLLEVLQMPFAGNTAGGMAAHPALSKSAPDEQDTLAAMSDEQDTPAAVPDEQDTPAAMSDEQMASAAAADTDGRPFTDAVLQALDSTLKSLDEIRAALPEEASALTMPALMQELMLLCLEERAESQGGMYRKEKDSEFFFLQ